MVNVHSSTHNDITAEATWPAFADGTPYFINGNITINSGVRIQAGATFLFNFNTTFSIVGASSYLIAKGTTASPITFTGKQLTKGYWHDLYFNNSNSTLNELNFVNISYGGSLSFNGRGNISMDNSSRLSITNSVISNSGQWGIVKYSANCILNSDATTANTFSGNELGNIKP